MTGTQNRRTVNLLLDTNILVPLEPAGNADVAFNTPLALELQRLATRARCGVFLGGPTANAFDPSEFTDDFLVGQTRQAAEVELAGQDLIGKVAEMPDLAGRNAGGFEGLVGQGLERCGGKVLVTRQGDEALHDRTGGGLGELLVDNGLGEMGESAFLALEAARADFADDLGITGHRHNPFRRGSLCLTA